VIRESIGRKFARLTTNVVVRNPRLWRVFRPLMQRQFDSLAPVWESLRLEDSLASYEAGLERLPSPPSRALDVGTGTGAGALTIARRFPEAHVVGVDVATGMIEEARRNVPDELRSRVELQQADAASLPFGDGSFDLVAHANMIPFFDEVARVLVRGGYALFAFSSGPTTPIYVPPQKLRSELQPRGFTDFAELTAGRGNGLLARKADRA
jgi:ubiquinone/menaquinone biosynthesis C-methylase UbiE